MAERKEWTAEEWNRVVPVGARVSVNLVNGDVLWIRTASPAARVGSYDMLELEGKTGLWLLSWCQPLEPPDS
jgi:hypothetical protein